MAATQSKLWHLERINLFKELSSDELDEIDERTTMRSAAKNNYIYFPEEPSTVIFFLKSGRVKIGSFSEGGKEVIKAILNPGEFFGELGIAGESQRNDFAIAMDDDTRFCAMNVDDVKEMMSKNASLSLAITATIGKRLRKVERRLEALIFKDARTRIVDFIKEMAADYGTQVGEEVMVKHNLTHQDIASLTATSRQTVTSVLNGLKDDNKIHLERNRLLVRNMSAL
jgi:CRP/FNR family cyclic AMP-dependent transcriptional regulator